MFRAIQIISLLGDPAMIRAINGIRIWEKTNTSANCWKIFTCEANEDFPEI
jgi:hypothetical protein